jgi:hypothetical protein
MVGVAIGRVLQIVRGREPGSRPPTALQKKTKKADVAEHPEVSDHVGLLINEPLGTAELLFI